LPCLTNTIPSLTEASASTPLPNSIATGALMKIAGNPRMISTFAEEMLKVMGFKLIHDGSVTGSAFFTRKYQMVLDGKPVHTFVTLRYDMRTNWADMVISYKDLEEVEKASQVAKPPAAATDDAKVVAQVGS